MTSQRVTTCSTLLWSTTLRWKVLADVPINIFIVQLITLLGACGGSCACSTCHIIVESDEMYEKMEEPDDDENDMLDLAFGLTETSRLGCQIKMSKEIDGLRVKLPTMTRNLQASDFSKPSGRDAAK